MQKQFDILKKSRQLTLKVINGLTIDQLNKIPNGFNNNIAWNIAHLVVTQQVLCYKFSGVDCLISEKMIEDFRKGSAPTYTVSFEEFETIKEQLLSFPTKLEEDYNNKLFKNFTEYATSVDVTLASVNDAIEFNNLHEGIHLGMIMQLKKLV